jgi:uncharacterized cupin superfamily protein
MKHLARVSAAAAGAREQRRITTVASLFPPPQYHAQPRSVAEHCACKRQPDAPATISIQLEQIMPKKIDVSMAPTVTGTRYPVPYNEPCTGRFRTCLGDAAGLKQFGVNMTRLPAGCWSSQRHWHTAEDEFVFVLTGEVVLVTDAGEETLRAGECAGFQAGSSDGHHLQNRTDREAIYLEIGARQGEHDEVFYPDIDLIVPKGRAGYLHRDRTPYPGDKPRDPATSK